MLSVSSLVPSYACTSGEPPRFPRAAPPPRGLLPSPIRRRASSPRGPCCAALRLALGHTDKAAAPRWAYGKRRGRGVAAGGWRWGAYSRAGGAQELLHFLSAVRNFRTPPTIGGRLAGATTHGIITAFQERLLRLQWLVGSIVEPCVVATTVEALCGDARDAIYVCASGQPRFILSRCLMEQRARGVHRPSRTARHQITAQKRRTHDA